MNTNIWRDFQIYISVPLRAIVFFGVVPEISMASYDFTLVSVFSAALVCEMKRVGSNQLHITQMKLF